MLAVILMAAGSGQRMGETMPKQYLPVDGEKMLLKSVAAFRNCAFVDCFVTVLPEDWEDYVSLSELEEAAAGREVRVAHGGSLRTDSVYAGLLACEDADLVMIQDAARPFVDEATLARIYDALTKEGEQAVICGVTPKDTIKHVDARGYITETLPRDELRQAQTPQAFAYPLIRRSYETVRGNANTDISAITDDAMVVEKSGLARVRVVEGDYRNIKITTPEDLC